MRPPSDPPSRDSQARRQVTFICHDVLDYTMAGPGIRQYQLGRVLALEHDIIIAVPNAPPNDLAVPGLRFHSYDPANWKSIAVCGGERRCLHDSE